MHTGCCSLFVCVDVCAYVLALLFVQTDLILELCVGGWVCLACMCICDRHSLLTWWSVCTFFSTHSNKMCHTGFCKKKVVHRVNFER